MMYLFIFLLIFTFITSISTYLTGEIEWECRTCAIPHEDTILWLSPSRPPCLHPGQPVFVWQNQNETCPQILEIDSKEISLADGIILARQRLCFFDGPKTVLYRYGCEAGMRRGYLRIAHSSFSKPQRRSKRWARRRNPDANSVHFQQDKYVRELSEDASVDSVVVSVKASHASDQPLYYSMVAPQDSRSQNLFTLDTVTGEIRLAKSLDREVLDKHVLKVTAYERVDPTISASTTVVVLVQDVQDNSPVFERDSYFGEIREDAPTGTTVLSVFARDLDAGLNGEVEYSLGNGDGQDLLSINPKSGVIQTSAPLDRETLALIRLDVIASDRGTPKRQSTALIEITIIDVNDNAPVFDQESYDITISENLTLPAVIATVKANDKDFGLNGKVHYSMASSSTPGLTIDYSSGEVTLRERIDAKNSPATAIVRAKDSAQPALSSVVPLTITVIDINDHAPTFIAAQKSIVLEENAAIGEEVARVYALDEDSGPNGRVKYSFDGNVTDFSIGEDNGVIRTTKLVDREVTPRYDLKVVASDCGEPPLNSTTSIMVTLKDVNDNAPKFEADQYNITISEDTPRGSQIMTLRAIDLDEDQKISYKIDESDHDIFSILDVGEAAILSVSGQLKPEDHQLIVHILATDQGGLQGRTKVVVTVDDVNGPPVFQNVPFSIHVPEHSPIGFPVLKVKAIDNDRDHNAKVVYSVDSDLVKIDNETGDVTVSADLDREERASFVITITATDSAEDPLSTSTQLEVILDDVNDNSPQFTSVHYAATISEDIPVGTSFLQVSAVDSDTGPNGVVDYFLNETEMEDSKVSQLFRLDRTSGTLRVNAKLDRETHSTIELPIYAQDRGDPPKSSASKITLTLSDVNDNAPQFEQPSYDLYIAENAPIGTTVGTIVARDADEGPNAEMTFRIFGGVDAKLFDIEVDENQKGVVRILSRVEFDYEAKSNKFFLEIQASSEQLSQTVPVRIHVSDVNDNKPVLHDFIVLLNHFETATQMSRQIGVIPAYDPDQNATLEFFLEANDLIEADKYNGKLTLKDDLKRNVDLKLKSCVSDGANTQCATCRFLHVVVDEQWLSESVTLAVSRTSVDGFWDPNVFQRFRDAISTLSSWRAQDVHVIDVTRSSDDVIHVSLAVLEHGRVVKGWRLIETVKEQIKKLERLTLMRIDVISADSCSNEPCSHYAKCRQTLKFVGETSTHETDNFIAKTLKTVNTFVCECPAGFTSSDSRGLCDTRIDECFRGECMNNSTCVPLENGFRCECNEHFFGDRCEIAKNAVTCVPGYCASGSVCELEPGNRMACRHCRHGAEDADDRCRLRSVSFDGEGMLNVNRDLPRLQWSMQFSIATIAHQGVILFSGNKKSDFVEVSIHDRVLKVQFSVGDEKAEAKMESESANRVNDGEWHTIHLQYSNRIMTMWIDDCDPNTSILQPDGLKCAVRTGIELPQRCTDPTVPCYRFLDVNNGIFFGGRPGSANQIEKSFSGCISNLTLDGSLVDFSSIEDMHRVGQVHEGCRPKGNFCTHSKCAMNSKCVNKWAGHNCRCPHAAHQKGDCKIDHVSSLSRPVSLVEEESFVLYRPGKVAVPFSFNLELRTSRTDMQLMAVEFNQKNMFFKLMIDDGSVRYSIGDVIGTIQCPEFSHGHWTSIDIRFDIASVKVTIDNIYSSESKALLSDLTLDAIYMGLAPSTGHPSRFEGCIRNVQIDHKPIAVQQKSKIRQGCIVTNRCAIEGVCPAASTCQREWNKHRCVCHKGFSGDTCQPSCNVKNICGPGGLCEVSNSTRGYECICPNGRSGANCELEAPLRTCPRGWWGEFPKCRQCSCPTARGYLSQCEKTTGTCLCQKAFFSTLSGCQKCECGVGAASQTCSQDGHCNCQGDAVGRRCDRCSRFDHLLDPKTLKCVQLTGKCPSEIEYGVQWPTSVKGSVVRQSCPAGETGLATRRCEKTGRWSDVNSWNCTRPEYAIMVNKFDILDSTKLLTMVANATADESTIRGRNQQIAAEAVAKIFDNENGLPKSHVRSMKFTEQLITVTSKVLSEQPAADYVDLVSRLHRYVKIVAQTHNDYQFLEPFFIANEHIVFSFDRLDYANIVPKFNNFVDTRPEGFKRVKIFAKGGDKLVYSIIPYPRCPKCGNPIVIVDVLNATEAIYVEFPIDEEDGWKYPECVIMKNGRWRDVNGLVGLNLTHAVCSFEESGVYSMFVDQSSSSIVRVSQLRTGTYLTIAALTFCSLAIIIGFSRRARNSFVRFAFIICFSTGMMDVFLVNHASINQVYCPSRNAFLSLFTSSPFAWLFLYSLHLYRIIAVGNLKQNILIHCIIGILLPLLISLTTFFFASDSCSLSPELWLFWFIVIPMALFLLLSFYSAATAFLVSCSKNYDIYVVKMNLRNCLLEHSLLTFFTVLYNVVGIFCNYLPYDDKTLDLTKGVVNVTAAGFIFLWTIFAKQDGKIRDDRRNMWLDPQKSSLQNSTIQDRQCGSPLLSLHEDQVMSNNEWITEVAPNEIPTSFLTPTKERVAATEAVSHILSPAEKILSDGVGHVYGNMGTLPRIRNARDEADDAYYTYTSRRFQSSTFSRT